MADKDKKRDPMPPPDATPEEIGDFWDTHSLVDYLDETREVEFEVNLKSKQNQTADKGVVSDQSDTLTTKQDASAEKKDMIMSDETKPDIPVTINDVAGNALGIVDNLLTTIDLPASTVKNLYKVIGRFCSAAVDIPIAHLEGIAAEKRAVAEARVRIIGENADQIAKQMNVPQEYVRRVGNKYAQKIIGEQINLDNISAFTLQELQKPKTEKSSTQDVNDSNKENPDVTTDQDTNNNEEKAINDDWLNRFETEARQKSSEEMQRRFARILAGEIEKPGSYSIKAVKILGELNQNAASLFKKLCSIGIVLENPVNKQFIDFKVSSLGGDPGKNILKKYGLPFSKLNILSEYGLIIPEYNSGVDYQVSIVDDNNRVLAPFRHQGRYWALQSESAQENIVEFRIWGIALTRVGRELLHIVDQDPMPEYTEDLKKFFASQKLQMVEVPISIPKVEKA